MRYANRVGWEEYGVRDGDELPAPRSILLAAAGTPTLIRGCNAIGIVTSLPLVVTAGTLAACGTLLLAMLSYIGAAH